MEDLKAVNTLEEVRKLQDLVRTLEIQNLQLRNRQNLTRKRTVSPVKDPKSSKNSWPVSKNSDVKVSVKDYGGKPYRDNVDEYFDGLEIITVSDIEMSDDESWLYSSPKCVKHDQPNENSLTLLKKDVDNPVKKQLQLAKKTLFSKFAQNQGQARIDSRTFIRSKRKQAIESLAKIDFTASETPSKTNTVQLHRRSSDVSSDSVSSCHILEYASDVEEVARMQEESLRMSSPSGTSQLGSRENNLSSSRVSISSPGSISDQELSENSEFGIENLNDSSNHEYLENSTFQEDLPQHYSQPSPPKTPYGSDASLYNTGNGKGKSGAFRGSLPNLNMHVAPIGQSKTNFCSDSARRQGLGKGIPPRKRLNFPLSQQKARKDITSPSRQKHFNQIPSHETFQSHGNFVPTNLVPRMAGSAGTKLPARSGLPRPAKTSSIKSTPRSGIPMPSADGRKHSEDSWSEGCY